MCKKILGTFFSFLILAGFCSTAMAANVPIQPRWKALRSIYTELNEGSHTVDALVSATAMFRDYVLDMSVELQKNDDGWETVESWDDKENGHVSLSAERYVSSGYSYRLYVCVDVYDGDELVESVTSYSKTVEV